MNTTFGQQAVVPSENGAVTGTHSDKVLILDAGAQYGKVSLTIFFAIQFSF